ncbi:MAG: hypothetical protein WCI84_10880 [Bacteroidota bacterium]
MNIQQDKVIPALYGGLLIATVWAVPGLNFLNCLCCAGVMLGGFLAVLLYQKDIPPESGQLTREDCVQLGIYAGIISSVAAVLIQYTVTLLFGDIAIEMMMRLAERMQVDLPPEIYPLIDEAKKAEPNLIGSFLAIFIYIVPNTLFSFFGALIGWKVFQPKNLL